VEAEIFDFIGLRKLNIIDFNWWAGRTPCSDAFLDISQAFDKVWHAGLLYKLRQALPLNSFLILKSYLHNRHFLVKVGNDYSELTSIHAGVPQGSVLGQYLVSF
jgi:hypothetical protein